MPQKWLANCNVSINSLVTVPCSVHGQFFYIYLRFYYWDLIASLYVKFGVNPFNIRRVITVYLISKCTMSVNLIVGPHFQPMFQIRCKCINGRVMAKMWFSIWRPPPSWILLDTSSEGKVRPGTLTLPQLQVIKCNKGFMIRWYIAIKNI